LWCGGNPQGTLYPVSRTGDEALQTEQYPARLLRSFLDVGRHLTQDPDSLQVLAVIVERSMEMTGARYGAAVTIGPEGIEDFLHRGLTEEQVARLPHYPIGEGLLGAVVEERRIIRCPDLASHPKSVGFPNRHVPMKAFLGVPMLQRDEILGALYLTKSPDDTPFTKADEQLTVAMASMAAVALHHAALSAQARETAEALKQLDQLRSDFVAMVSHELRSPMTVVSGIAHILQWRHDQLTPTETAELLNSLGRESGRLGRLVSEFLDMEAIDQGQITLNKSEVDLVDLSCEAMIDAGHAQRTEIVGTVGDTLLTVDRDRIKQVLLNLITNAAKFSADGSPIYVGVEPHDNEVTVSVTDKGPGIEPDEMGLLFERFSRLSTTVKRPGSGIGLYVSRVIVELHGGRIWAESEPGRGATFSFALPRRR
jgi:signal transduction histidine kinase